MHSQSSVAYPFVLALALFGCNGKGGGGDDPSTSSGPDESSTGAVDGTSSGAVDGTDSGSTGATSLDGTTTDGGSTSAATESGTDTGGDACEFEAGECTEPGYHGPGDCDPYAQDCPAGEKCLPFDPEGQGVWDTTQCSPVAADPAGLGDPCTMIAGTENGGEDTCDVGLVCWDLVGNQGTCAEVCGCGDASPTCEGEGRYCAVYNNNAVAVCLDTCIPTELDACGENQVCLPTPDLVFVCINALADLPEGATCGALNDCAPGLLCANCGDSPCCQAWCDASDPDACGGETCDPLFQPGSLPHDCYDDIGICPSP